MVNMRNKRAEIIEEREFWKKALETARAAYLAIISGNVKSYAIADRELTKLDLPELENTMNEAQKKIAECDALLEQIRGGRRKAIAYVVRDW